MKLESRVWNAQTGWSAPLPTELDTERTLVIAFGDAALAADPAPVEELSAAFGRSRVLGCSTAGQILGTQITDGTLVVSIVCFERTDVRAGVTTLTGPEDSYDAGRRLAAELAAPDLRAVFVLSDGIVVNGSELVRGVMSAVPSGTVVTGGLAGDGERFERTWVLADGALREGAVVAVGLSGSALVLGSGSFGGWDHFGPERMVTRSKGNVLHELDGQPALELYKRYLGDRADGLPATALLFPLAIRTSRDSEDRTVRTVLGVDEESHSMTFAGDVPEGSYAQLMHANRDRLVEGAMKAAAMTRPTDAASCAGPELAVAISCVGRRLVLGDRTEDEIEATLDALDPADGSQLIGFYSYGEIAPHATGYCDLHNQTMTITTIAER